MKIHTLFTHIYKVFLLLKQVDFPATKVKAVASISMIYVFYVEFFKFCIINHFNSLNKTPDENREFQNSLKIRKEMMIAVFVTFLIQYIFNPKNTLIVGLIADIVEIHIGLYDKLKDKEGSLNINFKFFSNLKMIFYFIFRCCSVGDDYNLL